MQAGDASSWGSSSRDTKFQADGYKPSFWISENTYVYFLGGRKYNGSMVRGIHVCLFEQPRTFFLQREPLTPVENLHGRDVDERIATTLRIENMSWYLFYDRYNEVFKNSIIEQGLLYSINSSLQYSIHDTCPFNYVAFEQSRSVGSDLGQIPRVKS
jgi:hypothetical protein